MDSPAPPEDNGRGPTGSAGLLTLHPHVIGHRSRLVLVEALIDHIRGHPGVWFATHEEVARFCLAAAG